jgi:hypothetical protein
VGLPQRLRGVTLIARAVTLALGRGMTSQLGLQVRSRRYAPVQRNPQLVHRTDDRELARVNSKRRTEHHGELQRLQLVAQPRL